MRPSSLQIGMVSLIVCDMAKVSAFCQSALGLQSSRSGRRKRPLRRRASNVLIELRQDTNARLRSRREAGLFHTTFLLPSRTDLASWIIYASHSHIPVQGASALGRGCVKTSESCLNYELGPASEISALMKSML
jgi:catechol 2,3-dioxygenase